MSLFKSAFTVGSLTILSRLLGFVRDMLIASMLGAGMLADAFVVAFKLPNFFRTLFAEGAFNASFVPLYAGILAEKGEQAAKEFAEKIASFLVFCLITLTVLAQIFMPWVMVVLAPGFMDDPEKYELSVLLTRITFPYLIFMSLVSLQGGILNSVGRFAASSFAPVLLNVCMIAAALVLTKYTATPAHALSIGVTISGLAQYLWLLWAVRRAGIRLSPCLPRLNPEVKQMLKRMLPGVVGAGVTQLNLWISTMLATLIPGAVSYLYYADRVSQFPLAVIGTAIGTAMLPMLSRQIRTGKHDEAIATQNRAIETSLLFSLPAAAALAVLAAPVVSVLFERGEFGAEEALATSRALIVFAIGLPAFILIKVFTPGFFAKGDTRTPVRISILCLIINTILNAALIKPFGYLGLATGTVFASWLQVVLLGVALVKKDVYHTDARLRQRLPRIILCTVLMSVALWGMMHYTTPYFEERTLIRTAALSVLVGVGLAVFFGAAHVFKACNLRNLLRMSGK